MKRWIAMCLACLMMLSSACAETTLRLRINSPTFVNEIFAARYPSVTVVEGGYLPVDELERGLVTRSFEEDAFSVRYNAVDVANLIDKGFCLDLSDNEQIREAVARMHPALVAQVTREGKIYALPMNVMAGFPYVCNEAVWTELGYTAVDVPKSFPALLDFLEQWVVRNESQPLPYSLMSWDAEFYDEHTYASWLANALIQSYITQEEYAGRPLQFNNPELLALLERAKRVGEAIYRYCEPRKSSTGQNGGILFRSINLYLGGWDKLDTWMLDMRLSEDQPTLLQTDMSLGIVYAGASEPTLAMAFLAAELERYNEELAVGDTRAAFLYVDAEPVPNPRQARELRNTRNRIAIVEHRLAGDNTPLEDYLELTEDDYVSGKSYEDASAIRELRHFAAEVAEMTEREVEEELEVLKLRLAANEENAWDLSPEELEAYKRYAEHFILAKPSPFHNMVTEDPAYRRMIDQYANGVISAQQLMNEYDRIARMMAQEDE